MTARNCVHIRNVCACDEYTWMSGMFLFFFRFPFVELFDDFDVGSRDYLLARQTL